METLTSARSTYVSDHDGFTRAASQVGQGLSEESLLRLPHHCSFTISSELQSRHKGPGAESQTILTFVVPSLVDGDERSSVQNQSGQQHRRGCYNKFLSGWVEQVTQRFIQRLVDLDY